MVKRKAVPVSCIAWLDGWRENSGRIELFVRRHGVRRRGIIPEGEANPYLFGCDVHSTLEVVFADNAAIEQCVDRKTGNRGAPFFRGHGFTI